MKNTNDSSRWRQRISDLGMIPVLLVLCAVYSFLTIADQASDTPVAARILGRTIAAEMGGHGTVFVIVQPGKTDADFAAALTGELQKRGMSAIVNVAAAPVDATEKIEQHLAAGGKIDRIAATPDTEVWQNLNELGADFPQLAKVKVSRPVPYSWPNFLKPGNLLQIANQIAVVAIIAIGMTMVIIVGGIDLSVGSLIGLSGVITAYLIRDFAGKQQASVIGMVLCCCAGILSCALVGLFSGSMVTFLRVPSFIVTLSMMLVASGLSFRISKYLTISEVPDRFVWLGSGADLFHIPNAVILMFLLYGIAHIVMSRTSFGRYIYAVGGNAEAARLSGVPNRRIFLMVYSLSGALAGLGGVVMASTFKSGSAKYGAGYELLVIAAAVVGGTSLAGGQGKILGTLVGAFIIAVNDSGLSLLGVDDSNRKMVVGFVILMAVMLDKWRR